jgi:DNA-binding NarL/FixJ family response regulator
MGGITGHELRTTAVRSVAGTASGATAHVARSLWQDLLGGRAHIVDRFQEDGRSYLVARRREPRIDRECEALSAREAEVAIAAASGFALKTIAFDLGVTTSTICNHVRSIVRKTGLASRKELVFWFRFAGAEGAALDG